MTYYWCQTWNRSDFFQTGPDWPVWCFRPDQTDRLLAGPNSSLNRQNTGKKPAGPNFLLYRRKTGAFRASINQSVLSNNSLLLQFDEDIRCQTHNSWSF